MSFKVAVLKLRDGATSSIDNLGYSSLHETTARLLAKAFGVTTCPNFLSKWPNNFLETGLSSHNHLLTFLFRGWFLFFDFSLRRYRYCVSAFFFLVINGCLCIFKNCSSSTGITMLPLDFSIESTVKPTVSNGKSSKPSMSTVLHFWAVFRFNNFCFIFFSPFARASLLLNYWSLHICV